MNGKNLSLNKYDSKIPYKIILDSSYCIEYFINANNQLDYISPSCERVSGLPPEDFIENPHLLIKVIHPEDREKFKEHMNSVSHSQYEDSCELEFRIIHKDGTIRWISHHCSPVYSEEGFHLGRRSTNIDITHQKKIQMELASKEKDLEMLFNKSSDGFFYMMIDEPVRWDETVDKDAVLEYVFDHQRITKVNRSMWCDQYRAESENDFIGLTVRELFSHDIEHGKAVWREFFDNGVLYTETSEQRLTGEAMYIEGEYLCIYDDNGEITGHFGIQRDVTERKKAAKELERLNNRLIEEMSKAEIIHNRLFPRQLPDIPETEIETYFQPSMDLGGDFYDFIWHRDKLLIIMVDVSGHGLDGAMIATFIKSCIVNWATANSNNDIDVKEGLEFVAEQFQKMGYPDDYFACLFLGLFDPKTKSLSYSSTGFHTSLIVSKENNLVEMPLGGLPISGALPLEILKTESKQLSLEKSDILFFSTDGLIETTRQGKEYNEDYNERFLQIMKNNLNVSAKELKNHIVDDFNKFINQDKVADDVTFLILKA